MKKFKNICSVIFVTALILLGLVYLTRLTERKASKTLYQPFYEEKNPIDVLVLGSSHTYNAILPMELWADYGMTVYNLGVPGNRIPATYWMLRSALEYCTPKVVVMDGFFLSENDKMSPSDRQTHMMFDAMPFSLTKIRAVRDLTKDPEKRMEFLWGFMVYHDRWQELENEDFFPSTDPTNGAVLRTEVETPKYTFERIPDKMKKNKRGMDYLRKIVQLCKDQGIQIIFTYYPFPAGATAQREANSMYDMAEECEVDYINYFDLLDYIDFDIDCSDVTKGNGHLNYAGALFATSYLGNYLKEHFELADQRQNPDYSSWVQRYDDYLNFKINLFKECTELKSSLMVLQDDDYSKVLYYKGGNTLYKDPIIAKLFKRLGFTDEMLSETESFLFVKDFIHDEITIIKENEVLDTDFGEVSFAGNSITCNGSDVLTLEPDSEIGIVVFDHRIMAYVAETQY